MPALDHSNCGGSEAFRASRVCALTKRLRLPRTHSVPGVVGSLSCGAFHGILRKRTSQERLCLPSSVISDKQSSSPGSRPTATQPASHRARTWTWTCLHPESTTVTGFMFSATQQQEDGQGRDVPTLVASLVGQRCLCRVPRMVEMPRPRHSQRALGLWCTSFQPLPAQILELWQLRNHLRACDYSLPGLTTHRPLLRVSDSVGLG